MPFNTNENDRSPNEIFMKFNSCDIDGHTMGSCSTNIDNVIYKHVKLNGKTKRQTVAMFDFKHNGVTGGYHPTINLSQDSLMYMKDTAQDLKSAFFVLITFTKHGEQEFPMFFVIPNNELAWNEFYLLRGANNTNYWMTPHDMALFSFSMKRQTPYPLGEYQTLSKVYQQYKLPKIICGDNECCGDCQYCRLTYINNKPFLKMQAINNVPNRQISHSPQ